MSFKRVVSLAILSVMTMCLGQVGAADEIEILPLDIISYESFIQQDREALDLLKRALYEKGIVGMRGVPQYREKVVRLIETARAFSALPEKVKEAYTPNRSLGEVGFERGKEKFQRPDGSWVIDDLKVSYYGFVPDSTQNKWPCEIDLKTPFQELGSLMSQVGDAVMKTIGLIGPDTGIFLENAPKVGRLLQYQKSTDIAENPFWCGAHHDHGMFTVLLPAFYYCNGKQVAEPVEAGLFIKTKEDGIFKKVLADDPDLLLFQVGEFGQLVTNDAIRATVHRVHKAAGSVERYTMELFVDAPMDTVIHSVSELTADSRYGGVAGEPCTYRRWSDESYKRYFVNN